MQAKEIISIIESEAPLVLQESYDNSGLNIGDPNQEITGVLCCIDITEAVINEAIALGVNFIISHHPLIFQSIKSITGKNFTERIILLAIQHNIAIYSAHTNLDNTINGVNHKICQKLGLQNQEILVPLTHKLVKIVTFAPTAHAEKIRNALFLAGAGNIGKYDSCSFNTDGVGTFKANKGSKPYAGKIGDLHYESEIRIETIAPSYLSGHIIKKLLEVHPYEEVAYDIYPLNNVNQQIGAGMFGYFNNSLTVSDFLKKLKSTFNTGVIRYSGNLESKINKVAVCGGAGSFLIQNAIQAGCDAFITGDLKYHQFIDAENSLLLCDIGHYESEQFTKEIFYDLLTKKISKFALHLSKIVTNPIKYYT